MKKIKLCAIALSASLALGAMAGCNTAKETKDTADDTTEAVTSEETSAPSESSEDTEESVDSDNLIEMDAVMQEYANTFITSFVKLHYTELDTSKADITEILDFVHIHLKVDEYDYISTERKGEVTYETFKFETALKTAGGFLGRLLMQEDCEKLPAPPDAFGDMPAGPYYEDGKIWYQSGDGESYDNIAIVDYIFGNDDGTMTMGFTVYTVNDPSSTEAYHQFTTAMAASDSNLTRVSTGIANVDVTQYGGYTLKTFVTR